MKKLAMLLFLLLFCSSCSSSYTKRNQDISSKIPDLLSGGNTKHDVEALLGSPDWVGNPKAPNKEASLVWIYVHYQNSVTPPVLFPARSHPNEPGWYGPDDITHSEVQTLVISYTEEGLVQEVQTSTNMAELLSFTPQDPNTNAR